jgi:WXG100 family type VII secretion target
MAILRVDTDVMATSATRIGDAIDEIDGVLTLLNGDVNDMLAGWSGDAADAHRDMHIRFQNDALRINNSLTTIYEALLRTHATYVTQEADQTTDGATSAGQILA